MSVVQGVLLRASLALATTCCSWACTQDAASEQDAAAEPDATQAQDAGPDGTHADADPAFLRIEQVSATSTPAVPITVAGLADVSPLSVQLENGWGTAMLDGKNLSVLPYLHLALPTYDLVHAIAVGPDAIYSLWMDCVGGELRFLHLLGTDTPWRDFSANGTCIIESGFVTAAVSFPAVTVFDLALDPGYTVAGTNVQLASDGTGRLTIGGAEYEARVIKVLDCSSCGGLGWIELHMVVRATRAVGGMAIMYLFFDARDVEVDYGFVLPSLLRPPRTFFPDAVWSR